MTSIAEYSLTLEELISLPPEDTNGLSLASFVTDKDWNRLYEFRHSASRGDDITDYLFELSTEERFMFICFVLLAEGESL